MTLFVARVATLAAAELALQWGADAALVQDRFVWNRRSPPWTNLVPLSAEGAGSTPRAAPRKRAIVAYREGFPQQADADVLRQLGYKGILLGRLGSVFQSIGAADAARFVASCRTAGLACGVSAAEAPDVPRLLRLAPDFIVVDGPPDGAEGLDEEVFGLFRDLISGSVSQPLVPGVVAPPRPDRIFVRDLVLPMAIGAYTSELGRMQRVRVSVEAEIASSAGPPHDMRDVVSYDLLADAARQVAQSGHIAFVETVAEQIAERVLAHPRVLSARVAVEKLDLGPGSMGIEIVRSRQGSDR